MGSYAITLRDLGDDYLQQRASNLEDVARRALHRRWRNADPAKAIPRLRHLERLQVLAPGEKYVVHPIRRRHSSPSISHCTGHE